MAQTKKSGNFILHGGILAMAGIIVRVIGMLYRIPMVNIIGSEAVGVYSAAFNVYNIMLVLSSYGLPMAVSKLVSARLAKRKYKDAYKMFKTSLIISVITGGIAALLVFFGADFLEQNWYAGYVGIAIPLRVLAPTIFIVSVLGVFRGFYQGQGTTIPTAFSQLIEQVINAVVSILAGYILVNMYKNSINVAGYGAAGGTLGTAFGAFAALIFVVFIYIIYRPTFKKKMRFDVRSVDEDYTSLCKTIAITMIPIILGQTFYQISAMIDDIMYNNIMLSAGATPELIKISTGNFNSTYVILTGIPMGVASAMSASMLPSIVASKANGLVKQIRSKIRTTIKANMLIAMPSFIGLIILGKPVVQILFPAYDSVQGEMMLRIGAIAVVFYTLSTVTSSALQAIDRMNLPVIHASISLVVHIGIVWGLLKYTDMGIYAIVVGNATFPILIMVLNLIALYRELGYVQEFAITFGVPLISSIIMGVCTALTYKAVFSITSSIPISLAPALAVAFITYFGVIFVFKKKRIY